MKISDKIIQTVRTNAEKVLQEAKEHPVTSYKKFKVYKGRYNKIMGRYRKTRTFITAMRFFDKTFKEELAKEGIRVVPWKEQIRNAKEHV